MSTWTTCVPKGRGVEHDTDSVALGIKRATIGITFGTALSPRKTGGAPAMLRTLSQPRQDSTWYVLSISSFV